MTFKTGDQITTSEGQLRVVLEKDWVRFEGIMGWRFRSVRFIVTVIGCILVFVAGVMVGCS